MSAAPHPTLAPLFRGGGAPARLMAALAASEARAAALSVDLDDHPLCRPGAWGALAPAGGTEARLASLLRRLASAEAEAARTEPGRRVSGAGEPRASIRRPAAAPPAHNTGAGPSGASQAAPPAAGPGRGRAPSSIVGPTLRQPARRAATLGGTVEAEATASLALRTRNDPLLCAAAGRPVQQDAPPDVVRIVADLLGDPTGVSLAATQTPDGIAGHAEHRIESILERIVQRASGSGLRASGFRAPDAPDPQGGRQTDAASGPPAARGPGPVPLATPQNGIERLLARGWRENLVPAGQSAGFEARPSPDHPGPMGSHGARAADLAATRVGLRAEAGPASPHPAPAEAEAFARALTELLRREARSAGIDLKGGA